MKSAQNDSMDTGMAMIQAGTFFGAIITYVMPVVSLIFMVVSIISGCILIYKFFTKQK